MPGQMPSAAAMRQDYTACDGLRETELAPDWVSQFGRWFADATESGLLEPNAMVLATATPDARPSARTVLLKDFDADGFVFFTNYESRKGHELTANPYVCLVFPWLPMQRQVIVTGVAQRISRAETEEYFAQRPYGSRLGAWASPQSQVVPDRAALDVALAEVTARYVDGEPVPAPPHWGGVRVVPDSVEFWQGRTNRLHDRLRFRRTESMWLVERLAP